MDATKFLPPDDSTRGFDNIAGALTMSPALLEAYLSASGKISRLAMGTSTAPTQAVFDVPADTAQNHHVEGLPFGTRGGMLITHEFPADGLYSFTVKGVTGYFQAVLGGVRGEQLEVTVDGERVKLFDWDKEISNTTGLGKATPRVPIKAGLHRVGVTFLATNDIPATELNKPFQRTMNTPGSIPGVPVLPARRPGDDRGTIRRVARRRYGQPPEDLRVPAHRRVSSKLACCTAREDACARTIVSTLARHAFRRPVNAADQKLLMEFYQDARSEGGSFDDGIEAALQRILADPEFIYRGEREPATLSVGPELSHQRPRARLASVVLPVEQHSGRRIDRRGGTGTSAGPGRARPAGSPDAAGPAGRRARGQFHRASGWACARSRPPSRWSTSFPITTTTCGWPSSARSSCSSAA